MEKALLQPVTRTSTGKLPPNRVTAEVATPNRTNTIVRNVSTASPLANSKVIVSNKASAEEIKEKMEQELRLQRAEHNKKRTLEMMQQKKGKSRCATLCTYLERNFKKINRKYLMLIFTSFHIQR